MEVNGPGNQNAELQTGLSERHSHNLSGDLRYSDRWGIQAAALSVPPPLLSLHQTESTETSAASQNTYFIRQRIYHSEEEKTPKINFCRTAFPRTRCRKVTSTSNKTESAALLYVDGRPKEFEWTL